MAMALTLLSLAFMLLIRIQPWDSLFLFPPRLNLHPVYTLLIFLLLPPATIPPVLLYTFQAMEEAESARSTHHRCLQTTRSWNHASLKQIHPPATALPRSASVVDPHRTTSVRSSAAVLIPLHPRQRPQAASRWKDLRLLLLTMGGLLGLCKREEELTTPQMEDLQAGATPAEVEAEVPEAGEFHIVTIQQPVEEDQQQEMEQIQIGRGSELALGAQAGTSGRIQIQWEFSATFVGGGLQIAVQIQDT